ncbi:hypothetical protein [Synechococcus sp. UW86]|uniref:hypothetical protein n=1 Tax=Synechococcus sp. UW86 TaxID=368491 RepID=UPI000E0EE05D|nr:hypothetical protein [Synechococcus sp. UW86]
MLRSRLALLALLLSPFASISPAEAHGSHGGGGESLEAGEFDFTPIINIEGHGGFDTNLEGDPKHYAIDGMFGGVFEWGLANGGSFAIEAAIGPALVWGEAEHFYGKVHVDDHGDDHEEEHDDHDHEEDHDDHEGHDHGHDHSHDTDFKRTDIKGFLQARYAPNDRLSFELSWNPYYVTKDQGEDIQGLKNELGAKAIWALGDGDVNFALGDGIEDLVNGVYLSVDHRQGWESDGMYVGNYTDPRVGLGFTFGGDEISLMIEAGPRFYVPGSYAGLDPRTDLAGEIELSVPIGDATLFLHWQQTYSWEDAPGWGEGWQHHVGTGVTFTF